MEILPQNKIRANHGNPLNPSGPGKALDLWEFFVQVLREGGQRLSLPCPPGTACVCDDHMTIFVDRSPAHEEPICTWRWTPCITQMLWNFSWFWYLGRNWSIGLAKKFIWVSPKELFGQPNTFLGVRASVPLFERKNETDVWAQEGKTRAETPRGSSPSHFPWVQSWAPLLSTPVVKWD